MAFVLSNLSPALLQLQSKEKPTTSINNHQCSSLSSPLTTKATTATSILSPLTELDSPPNRVASAHKPENDDFYVNLGMAVRTLREDLPLLFTSDLNYDIYRSDVTFVDPLNKFTGIENYKLIFWALRFHGKVLFREISFEIFRVWQPSEHEILIRWYLRGFPRVPWEAKGQFQGTFRYKLDRIGKIYVHKVDNLAFNFPMMLKPPVSVFDLVAASPPSPNPTFFLWDPVYSYMLSWLKSYRAIRETLNDECSLLIAQDYLIIAMEV